MFARPLSTRGLWSEIGHQFRHPTGTFGRVMGRAMSVINRRPNALAIEALDIQPSDDVLELGCGPGAALAVVAKQTRGRIYGIDQSRVMLAQSARRNRKLLSEGRLSLECCHFDALPLGNASVDKVLAVNVIYFWRDMNAVLLEIGRVLRPGGALSIYATDASAMRHWKFASTSTHRLFDAAALTAALKEGPFDGDTIAVHAVTVMGLPGLVAVVKQGAAAGS
ncbi:MAG: methyltransferase domain-containing protein [Alphaproteobacteria bacterium]|nr:methyltransferase domain-containing protein [Alphaproteobacteria bacterium]